MADGLDGVVAAQTILSHTDSANGMVWVRGHDLPTLVARHGFEGTIALLWDGFAAAGLCRSSVAASLGKARHSAFETLPLWLPETVGRPLFEGVRIALAAQPDAADGFRGRRFHCRCGGADSPIFRAAALAARSRADDRRRPAAHAAWL